MGTKSWENIRALRAVLVLFETMSDLKVNFSKSILVEVNIPDSWLVEAALALGYKVGKIPFLYLCIPIWGDPRRLVLLKSVLTSLPVCAFSFFKAHSIKGVQLGSIRKVALEGLWFRVLAARYGVERGRLCVAGTRGSSWWREVVRIRDGGGEAEGGWFGGAISRDRWGMGLIRTDPWVDV
ncbi:hypothetical protein TSUD_276750 [Trifolium subterraneum]|uniref:Reverse transcriptase domain-containing protein n=1 Tax=Trifolium subterraneum TaxID=3900 RepID=A0A2Z6N442_TRISU|nr:hypothetical protein TSUD_276750 [Trifolium subterraneum]